MLNLNKVFVATDATENGNNINELFNKNVNHFLFIRNQGAVIFIGTKL